MNARPVFLLSLIALLVPCLLRSAPDTLPARVPLAKIRVRADKTGFETVAGARYVPIGVNYFRPGTGWAPQVWKQFDAAATREDFAKLKSIGVTCARVFLSYGSFFTHPSSLDPAGLASFDEFLRIAEDHGIYVHPTGPDHWEGVPAWARGDRYAEEELLHAQEIFWRLLATRYRGRAVIFAYDLLNEPTVRWDSPAMRTKWNEWLRTKYRTAAAWTNAWHAPARADEWGRVSPPPEADAPGDVALLDYQSFRESIADEWTRRQVRVIKSADPEALVTVGLIQWAVPALLARVSHYAAFRPARQAPWLDFLEVHFYPLEHGFYEYAEADEAPNLAYLESVVREVARPGKPVVLAEFGWYGGGKLTLDGGKHAAATEEQQARWCRRTIETTAGDAVGWLNWGVFDHPEARDVTQLNGLFTVEGKPKAWARTFAELSAAVRSAKVRPRARGDRPEMDWDACLTSVKAGHEFRRQYLKAWLKEPGFPKPTSQ